MSKTERNTALIAGWAFGQDPSSDTPNAVRWDDGSPATHNDYLTHIVGTHKWVSATNGRELHMFPDVIADVRFDDFARAWVVSGIGVTSGRAAPHRPSRAGRSDRCRTLHLSDRLKSVANVVLHTPRSDSLKRHALRATVRPPTVHILSTFSPVTVMAFSSITSRSLRPPSTTTKCTLSGGPSEGRLNVATPVQSG